MKVVALMLLALRVADVGAPVMFAKAAVMGETHALHEGGRRRKRPTEAAENPKPEVGVGDDYVG